MSKFCFALLYLIAYLVFLFVRYSLVITCWERVDLLALLYVMFYCVFVIFPCGVLGQVWCLILSIPDLCLLSYFGSILYDFFNAGFMAPVYKSNTYH